MLKGVAGLKSGNFLQPSRQKPSLGTLSVDLGRGHHPLHCGRLWDVSMLEVNCCEFVGGLATLKLSSHDVCLLPGRLRFLGAAYLTKTTRASSFTFVTGNWGCLASSITLAIASAAEVSKAITQAESDSWSFGISLPDSV